MEKLTSGVAVAGLTTPAWLPTLSQISEVSAHLLPVFSLIWLIMQICRALSKWRSKNDI